MTKKIPTTSTMAKAPTTSSPASTLPEICEPPDLVQVLDLLVAYDENPNLGNMDMTGVTQITLKKALFLKTYCLGARWKDACAVVGCHVSTPYRWEKSDPVFAALLKEMDIISTKALLDEASRRAVDGVAEPIYQGGELVGTKQKYSDPLLQFMIKNKVDRFADKQNDSASVNVLTHSAVFQYPNNGRDGDKGDK